MVTTRSSSGGARAYFPAVAWIGASFVMLAAGLIAGALVGGHVRWILPTAGFVGYLLAMRQGLKLWNPEGLDRIWRRSKALSSGKGGRRRSGPAKA
jgi:hypothetical protein